MRCQSADLVLLVLISITNSASQILMRWGGMQSAREGGSTATTWHWLWISRWWLSGIVVGWIAGLGWAWCLRRLPLGLAIPVYAGLAYVLSVISGAYILRERMSALQIAGAVVILAGILLVTLSSAPQPVGPTRQ